MLTTESLIEPSRLSVVSIFSLSEIKLGDLDRLAELFGQVSPGNSRVDDSY